MGQAKKVPRVRPKQSAAYRNHWVHSSKRWFVGVSAGALFQVQELGRETVLFYAVGQGATAEAEVAGRIRF